jgi:Domain of unknown function (DUF4157)
MQCACGGGCPRCSNGRPIDPSLRVRLQRHLGADLSGVRVHAGQADAVAAAGARRGFAAGETIVTASTAPGAALIAHEAAHVVQQRAGSLGRRDVPGTAVLESEARRSADAFAAGRPAPAVRAGRAEGGRPQFDEPASADAPAADASTDEEVRVRLWFSDWLAQQAAATSPQVGVPLTWREPVSRLGAETLDVGSLYVPYHQRNLFPGGGLALRDSPVIESLFAERYRFVQLLPEVRDIVPGFARSWIPGNWRVSLAATLTSTTVDWALSGQHPNFFELSNQAFERFTGATTYSTPMLTVPVVSDLWNRFSSGGR